MVTIEAKGKINLTLDILGLREDGYHQVSMVMQEISLHDEIVLKKLEAGIRLDIAGAELPGDQSNLCWKAAKLLQDEYNIEGGVHISLKKRIPIAAGLAGGSADAAAVLKGMNTLYELGLSQEQLCDLGARLGSDIPFCIMGGTMLAEGRGEVLTRLEDFPFSYVVLAKPPIGVSTAWAYKEYDKGYTGEHPNQKAMLRAIEEGNRFQAIGFLGNVLEEVTGKKYTIINEYKRVMLENGAMAAMMSGSGPTVFSLVEDLARAEAVANALREFDGQAEVFIATTVGRE